MNYTENCVWSPYHPDIYVQTCELFVAASLPERIKWTIPELVKVFLLLPVCDSACHLNYMAYGTRRFNAAFTGHLESNQAHSSY